MTVIAPFYQSEGIIEPYVSLNEVKFSPTAAAIDFSNLIENASIVAQDRALSELIKRASSKADIFCYGKLGTLNASLNTENGWYRPNRDGNITFSPSFTPILAVTDVQCGWGPGSGLAEITISSSNGNRSRKLRRRRSRGICTFDSSGRDCVPSDVIVRDLSARKCSAPTVRRIPGRGFSIC